MIARFLPDGSVDTDFAIDGLYTSNAVRSGEDVIVLPGGNIMATGYDDEHLVRLLPDGAPDQAFSGDGVTGSQFFNPDDPVETEEPGMARLIPWPGGRTIVGGTVDYGPYFFTFARYDAAGELDNSFGDNGQVQTDFSPSDDHLDQEPLALMVYDDTHFVAAGYREVSGVASDDSVIAMYDASGELDPNFGDNGKTTNEFFEFREEIRDLLPQPEDRILAVGRGQLPITGGGVEDTVYMARYDADGTLDDNFGDNGVIIYDPDGAWTPDAAALLDGGSIVVGGTHENRPFLAKFDAEGAPTPRSATTGGCSSIPAPPRPRDSSAPANSTTSPSTKTAISSLPARSPPGAAVKWPSLNSPTPPSRRRVTNASGATSTATRTASPAAITRPSSATSSRRPPSPRPNPARTSAAPPASPPLPEVHR